MFWMAADTGLKLSPVRPHVNRTFCPLQYRIHFARSCSFFFKGMALLRTNPESGTWQNGLLCSGTATTPKRLTHTDRHPHLECAEINQLSIHQRHVIATTIKPCRACTIKCVYSKNRTHTVCGSTLHKEQRNRCGVCGVKMRSIEHSQLG